MIRWCNVHRREVGDPECYFDDCRLVDAVVLVREPCIECEERPGFGGINTDDGSEYPCEWCGGSGTTWPDANDTTPFYDGYGTHGEVYTWGEVLDYVTDALAEGEQT